MGFSAALMLTNNGKAYLSDAQLGKTLRFTKMILGDGNPGGAPPIAMTAVVSPRLTVLITEMRRTDSITVYVRGDYTNATIVNGFYYRELGLYADHGEGTSEILYCYGYAGALAEYIDAQSGASTIEKIIALQITTDNAENVTAVFDESTVHMLEKEYNSSKKKGQVQFEEDERLTTEQKTVHGAVNALSDAVIAANNSYKVYTEDAGSVANARKITLSWAKTPADLVGKTIRVVSGVKNTQGITNLTVNGFNPHQMWIPRFSVYGKVTELIPENMIYPGVVYTVYFSTVSSLILSAGMGVATTNTWGAVRIANNVITTATGDVLDATQGRLLNNNQTAHANSIFNPHAVTAEQAGAYTIAQTNENITHTVNALQIQSGSNVNGSYTKFPDGTLICTKKVTATGVYNTPYNVYYSMATQTLFGNWAYPFMELPSRQVSVDNATGGASPYAFYISGTAPTMESMGGVWGIVNAGSPAVIRNITYSVTGIGRWNYTGDIKPLTQKLIKGSDENWKKINDYSARCIRDGSGDPPLVGMGDCFTMDFIDHNRVIKNGEKIHVRLKAQGAGLPGGVSFGIYDGNGPNPTLMELGKVDATGVLDLKTIIRVDSYDFYRGFWVKPTTDASAMGQIITLELLEFIN